VTFSSSLSRPNWPIESRKQTAAVGGADVTIASDCRQQKRGDKRYRQVLDRLVWRSPIEQSRSGHP